MPPEEFPLMSGTADLEKQMGVAPKAKPAPVSMTPPRVSIVLEENDDIPPTGLYVGVNGVGYLLRPGETIDVPQGVVEALDHAVMEMPHIDPQTQQVVGWRKRMRYPYRRV